MIAESREILILFGVLGIALIPPVTASFLITKKERRKQSLGYLVLSIYAAIWAAASIWYFLTDGTNNASGVFAAFALLGSLMAFNKHRSHRSEA